MSDCFDKFVMLGIPFDRIDFRSSVERIISMLKENSAVCRTGSTVNVDFVCRSLRTFSSRPQNPELLAMLRECDFVCADGMPLVWLSKLLGVPLPGRVAGADLVPALAERAADEGIGIYILGGEEDKTRKAVEILRAKHSGLIISGFESPYVNLDDAGKLDEIVDRINRSGAKLLFIALGNPKQEIFLRRTRQKLRTSFAIGVGGTFNFIAGDVKRAPEWARRTGLEWIYRIIQEPKRLWKRYAMGLPKISILAVEALLCAGWSSLFAGKNRLAAEELLELARSGELRRNASRIQLYGTRLLDLASKVRRI